MNILDGRYFFSSFLFNFFPIDVGLECYYCQENGGEEHSECTADIIGEPVHCQISEPSDPHYGDVCAVGHVG